MESAHQLTLRWEDHPGFQTEPSATPNILMSGRGRRDAELVTERFQNALLLASTLEEAAMNQEAWVAFRS